jgi:hypothetical protein
MPSSIGIPYATARVESGRLIRTCPDCGLDIMEATDATGETETNRYGEHFERLHVQAAPLMPKAFLQVHLLNRSGWSVRAWDADLERRLLLVDGTDNYGDRFRGQIDAQGNLSGEPVQDDD